MTRRGIDPTDAVAINAVLFAVRQAADVICDRWVLSLMVAALAGERRFGRFMERTGMASRVVTARLRTLEALGLFARVAYRLRPLRHEYRLTVMGEEFFAVVVQMIRWEQQWSRSPDGAGFPLHRCGLPLRPDLRCRSCGETATIRDVDLGVSRSQLLKVPVKQTLHRRSAREGAGPHARTALLGESLDIFGDKWSVEILICAFFRVRRFNDFRRQTGISANILGDRLDRLTAAGVLRRGEASTDGAAREFRLTDKGVDLFGILIALQDWADAWVGERYRSPVRFVHRSCGQTFHAAAQCGGCATAVGGAETIAFSVPS